MSDEWYVRKGHKTLGPLTESEVRQVLETGRISPDTPVRQGENGAWKPAARALEGLKRPGSAPAAEKSRKKSDREVRRALGGGKGKRAPGPGRGRSKKRSRTTLAIAAVAGLAIVAAGLWFAFGAGRHHVPSAPLAATDSSAEAAKPTVVAAPSPAPAPAKSAIESAAKFSVPAPAPAPAPAVPNVAAPAGPAPAPASPSVRPRPSLVAQRPTPSQSTVARELVATKPVQPQQKPADVAHIVEVAPAILHPPATPADLAALEATALRSPTAKDALAFYEVFRTTRPISPPAADLFKTHLDAWEARAGQGLARLGDQWLPAADAARARQEAAQLFRQADEMIRASNFIEARRSLDMASRVDPNSIAADFTAGLLSAIAPAKLRSPLTASKHFEIVLQRSPGYVAALNNLALAEVREEKYAEAVGHLREAADHWPAPDEVLQNLGRFVSEARLGRIHPGEKILAEARKLYSGVSTAKERAAAAAADGPKHGWRYMALVLPQEEREGLLPLAAPLANAATVAQGTGLVVEPHYVLTCRHLIDDFLLGRADKIELVDPTDFRHERRLPATLAAVDEADDLCLLRCDGLSAPPIALGGERLPPRGSELALLDFPGRSASELELKTTRGIVTALPGQVARVVGSRALARLASAKWLDFSRQLWCDAGEGHRANGGALCDDHGNIVAIHAAAYAKYAGGIPSPVARVFVQSALPSFARPPLGGLPQSWPEVEEKIGPSCVSVMVGYRKVVVVMPDNGEAGHPKHAEGDIYDDRLCTVCNGRVRVLCRAPGCPFARLHDERFANDPGVADTLKGSPRHTCPACLGTGYVRCPHCSIGIDPQLR